MEGEDCERFRSLPVPIPGGPKAARQMMKLRVGVALVVLRLTGAAFLIHVAQSTEESTRYRTGYRTV